MIFNFAGKNALITGSSSGIGLAIARTLNFAGCRVALNGRNKEKLEKVAKDFNDAIVIAGDVTIPEVAKSVVHDAVQVFGHLDILICCVGCGRSVEPGLETPEEWQRIFALNFWSTTNVIESAVDALSATEGVILCISSICGVEVIPGAPLTYSASKAALNSYVRGIARILGKKGVRVNAIAPGNILSAGSVWEARMNADREALSSILESNVALGRLGLPSDVAGLAVYLVSNLAGFATGGIWVLDGGQIH